MVYVWYVLCALAAWFIGLFLDVNLNWSPVGLPCLRVIFPILVTGIWILQEIRNGKEG